MNPESVENLTAITKELITRMGYIEPMAQYHEDKKRLSVFVNDASGKPLHLREEMKEALEHVLKQLARKQNFFPIYIDINNYRANREKLIVELSKAAARKVNITKKIVELPPMNAYERRLVHVELATRPDVKTESHGEGPSRHVVVSVFE